MKKGFGHLTRLQAKRVYPSLQQYNIETKTLHSVARASDKLESLVIPWIQFYEMPYAHHLACFLYLMGWDEAVVKAADSVDPQEAALDFFESQLTENGNSEIEYDEAEKQLITALSMALIGQVESIKHWSQPLSDLVAKAGQGDELALFRAVTVDRSAVACPSIAKQICLAQMRGDETFMDKLAKAVTRTKPAPPNPKYNDLRFMLEAVVEKEGIQQFTATQLEDILELELGLYPNDSDYSLRAFRKLIQKRNTMVGT